MALPGNVGTGTVIGRFIDGSGNARSGKKLLFTPQPAMILDPTASPKPVTILPDPVTVTLDPNGDCNATLIATDDTDLQPSGWTWNVSSPDMPAFVPFDFPLPQGTTVDLVDRSPLDAGAGVLSGFMLARTYTGTEWPERGTDRTDLVVMWFGGTTDTPPPGAAGVDVWIRDLS